MNVDPESVSRRSDAEEARDHRSPKVPVDEQHARVLRRQGDRQVDRREGLALARHRAGDEDHGRLAGNGRAQEVRAQRAVRLPCCRRQIGAAAEILPYEPGSEPRDPGEDRDAGPGQQVVLAADLPAERVCEERDAEAEQQPCQGRRQDDELRRLLIRRERRLRPIENGDARVGKPDQRLQTGQALLHESDRRRRGRAALVDLRLQSGDDLLHIRLDLLGASRDRRIGESVGEACCQNGVLRRRANRDDVGLAQRLDGDHAEQRTRGLAQVQVAAHELGGRRGVQVTSESQDVRGRVGRDVPEHVDPDEGRVAVVDR